MERIKRLEIAYKLAKEWDNCPDAQYMNDAFEFLNDDSLGEDPEEILLQILEQYCGRTPEEINIFLMNAKDYLVKQLQAELDAAKKTIDQFWESLSYSYAIESRDELEKDAVDNWNPPNPLVVALHHIWKRDPKVEVLQAELDKVKGLLKETLDMAIIMGELDHDHPLVIKDKQALKEKGGA